METALQIASKKGDVIEVKRIVKLAVKVVASINQKEIGSRRTPAHLRHYLNIQDYFGRTAIHYAALGGHMKVVEVLLENNSGLHLQDMDGKTAIQVALDERHTEILSPLLQSVQNIGEKIDLSDMNAVDQENRTVLHYAVIHCRIDLVRCLVRHKCDIRVRDRDNKSPLSIAMEKCNYEISNILIEAASLSKEGSNMYPHFNTKPHNSCSVSLLSVEITIAQLERALREKDELVLFDIMDILVKSDPTTGMLLLLSGSSHKAQREDLLRKHVIDKFSLAEVQAMLQHREWNLSPFSLACKNNLTGIVKLFAEECLADINEGTPTAFWQAANVGHEKVIQFLAKQKGIDFQKSAPDGTTPLMMAIAKGHSHLIPYFEKLYGDDGFKILKICVKFGQTDMISKEVLNKLDESKLKELIMEAELSYSPESQEYVNLLVTSTGLNNELPMCSRDADLPSENADSDLQLMSLKYPVFNSDIEESWVKNCKYRSLDFTTTAEYDLRREIGEHMLNRFCCINPDDPNVLRDMVLMDCRQACIQKLDCSLIKDLMIICQHLEKQMQSEKDLIMNFLKPQFILIGSVAEGTRVGKASEADVTIKFSGLDAHPLRLGATATELLLPSEKEAKLALQQFNFYGSHDKFDYPKFLQYLLQSLESCIKEIDFPTNLEIVQHNNDYKPCDKCREISHSRGKCSYVPNVHCEACSPVVTHTKVGACLVFKRKKCIDSSPMFATIDLVPVYPIRARSTLDLFTCVNRTLVKDQPPFWLDHFRELMQRDIILPEVFENTMNSHFNSDIQYVAIKLLHYGPAPNFIIRPGQELEIERFSSYELLKSIFIYMKGLKDILSVDAKSYFMKKVVLCPSFVAKTQEPNALFGELLLHVMSHPDLKKLFQGRINYDMWTEQYRVPTLHTPMVLTDVPISVKNSLIFTSEFYQEFFNSNDILQKVYNYVISIKEFLNINVEAHLIRKSIFSSKEIFFMIEKPNIQLPELLYFVLSEPDLKTYFQEKVDFERWNERIHPYLRREIPLKLMC